MSDNNDGSELTIKYMINNSNRYKSLIQTLKSTASLSITGITNFVVDHENPYLVDCILKQAFKQEQLFNGTVYIDAVELQHGRPGRGSSVRYLDELIYGTFQMIDKGGQQVPDVDPETGVLKRQANGLTNRKGLRLTGDEECLDKLLIIRNIDFCLDFCKSEDPGVVDTRALMLLDRFRDPKYRLACGLILITNKPLNLPFSINTVEIKYCSNFEVRHFLNVYLKTFQAKNFDIQITESQVQQIVRKLSGMTYNQVGDILGYSFVRSKSNGDKKSIDMVKVLKVMRKKVNSDFMNGGFGLTQLESRPWEDYICPSASNFTFDIKKLLRDFTEVDKLMVEQKSLKDKKKRTKKETGRSDVITDTIDQLRTRMPHVIILYGQGGVGKSAFPIHLAGLLDMDVWDFNINATHSKWIGQGSEQMRGSLNKISQSSHVIVRIDEYDRAIGSTNERGGGMHEAHKQVESEFMNWLQNAQEENLFVKNNIFVVMTTNHVQNITGPMLRSGRADLVIDIGSFDTASMKEAFETCARRMNNRGVSVLGFESAEDLQAEINALDLDQMSELATLKRFTVRDIEMLIIEMAAWRYYYEMEPSDDGIPWTSESFVKVLEKSVGSVKDGSTGELILGDRYFHDEEPEDLQIEFGDVSDLDKLKETSFDED